MHPQVSLQDHSKKGQWTCHTHQWSQLPLVESGVTALEVMLFFQRPTDMPFLGPVPIYPAIHGPITDISKIFKSCFLLHISKI